MSKYPAGKVVISIDGVESEFHFEEGASLTTTEIARAINESDRGVSAWAQPSSGKVTIGPMTMATRHTRRTCDMLVLLPAAWGRRLRRISGLGVTTDNITLRDVDRPWIVNVHPAPVYIAPFWVVCLVRRLHYRTSPSLVDLAGDVEAFKREVRRKPNDHDPLTLPLHTLHRVVRMRRALSAAFALGGETAMLEVWDVEGR